MRRRLRSLPLTSRLLCLVAAVAVVAGGCSDTNGNASGSADGGDGGSPTTTTEASPDAAELAAAVEQPGQWGVGVSEVEVTGARDRALPVQVWYPVDPDLAAGAEPATYPFPGLEVPSASGVTEVPPAEGDFPVVVYSHGNGGLRYVSAFLTEHLASHGFVVLAPDHVGNTAVDSFAGTSTDRTQVALDRPVDIAEVITALEVAAPGLEAVAASSDTGHLAVIGHSFGGFTALATAGGYGDAPADPRVDAVVGMAAATSLLEDASLEAVDVPTLLEWATDDETVEVAENAPRPDDLVAGRPLVRADIDGAGHQSFTDVCDYQDLLATMPELPDLLVEAVDDYASEGCGDELLDIDEAHRLIRRVSTAFLLSSLGVDDRYEPLLEPPTGDDPSLAVLELSD